MKPKRFEMTVVANECTRHLSSDPDKPNGWWVGMLVGNGTTLRVFIPDNLFLSKVFGLPALLEPSVEPGQPLLMSIEVPVKENEE